MDSPGLWASLYATLLPGLIAYYNAVNGGHFLASSEARGYQRWAAENNLARSMQLAFGMFVADQAPTDTVLVLGTGSGFDTAIPAARLPQRRFIATEASPVASGNARQLLATLGLGNAEVRNTDYQQYLRGIPDASLGAATSNWTMSGALDPVDVLATVHAKLAPNGMLAITESPGGRLPKDSYDQQGVARLLEDRGDGITPKIYLHDMEATLAAVGFTVVSTTRGIPDTSDSIIAAKGSALDTIPAQDILAHHQPWLDQSRQMVANLLSNDQLAAS